MSNKPLSPLEHNKANSRFLRGTIDLGLADPGTGAISEPDTKLLKFHGSYQQDNRDLRDERRRQKLEPDFSFMVRVRLPGGVLTPAQIPSTTSYRPRAAVRHRLLPSTREAAKISPPSTKRMRSAVTVKITKLTAMLAIPARNVSRILRRRTKGNWLHWFFMY